MMTLLFAGLCGQIFPQCMHHEYQHKSIENCHLDIHISAVPQAIVVFAEDNPRFPIELKVEDNAQVDSISIIDLRNADRCKNGQEKYSLYDDGLNLDKRSGDNIWTTEIPVRCFNFNTPYKLFRGHNSYKIEVVYTENGERVRADYFYSDITIAVQKGFLSNLDTSVYHQLNDTIAYTNNLVNILELTNLSHDNSQHYRDRLLSVDLFRKTWSSHRKDIVSLLYGNYIKCFNRNYAFADWINNTIVESQFGFNVLNHELNHIWFNQEEVDLGFNRHHARYLERNTSGFNFEANCYGGFFDRLIVEEEKIYGEVVPNEDEYEIGTINEANRFYNYFNDIELYLMGAIPIDSVHFPIRHIPLESDLTCIQSESDDNLFQLTDKGSISSMSQAEFESATQNKRSFGNNSQVNVKFVLITKELIPKRELLVLDHIITLYQDYFKESTYGLAELNTQIDKIVDLDNDGYLSFEDCDDSAKDINPAQEEIPYNDKDDDCNVNTLDNDLDQDGFKLEDDCDDLDPAINPGLTEIPDNEIDENCDGIVETTTSTDELSGIALSIYPNPTSDVLHIEFEEHIRVDINLYSMTHNVYLQSTKLAQFDMKSLESGLYILVIRDQKSKQVLVRKIIKH